MTVSLLAGSFPLSHPCQVVIVSAVLVDDGAVGLEGDDAVTGGGQHFVVMGSQQHNAGEGFRKVRSRPYKGVIYAENLRYYHRQDAAGFC